MLPTIEERFYERITNGALARLDAIEARLKFYDDDLMILETLKERIFYAEQALRSIDNCMLNSINKESEERKEIAQLKRRIEGLEKEQTTQGHFNVKVARHIRIMRRGITKLIRFFFRLNNSLESEKPNLVLLEV